MPTNSVLPLKFPRLITLCLAWAWAVIGLGIEINALVQSNKDKAAIKDKVPPPATISIDTNDVFRAGAVVTAVSAAILALTTVYIVLLVIDSKTRSGISTRTLPLQSFSLWFFALWLFAAQIPVSLFVSKRSIKVTASVFGVTIQDSDLKTIERQLGAKTMYKDYHYLLWVFTLAAAVVCLVASSSARASSTDEPVSSEKGTPQAAPTK